MSYAMTCVLLANVVFLPALGILCILMGTENWRKWLLLIPAILVMDLDHFLLTNVPGFAAHPEPGQKILHITVEFVAAVSVFLVWYFLRRDPRRGWSWKTWLFPPASHYEKYSQYLLAWSVRILVLGMSIHWLLDLIIYSLFHKWDYLYVSLLEYLLHPG
jgi:hypothetical protein